jgi:hypothetical protein
VMRGNNQGDAGRQPEHQSEMERPRASHDRHTMGWWGRRVK